MEIKRFFERKKNLEQIKRNTNSVVKKRIVDIIMNDQSESIKKSMEEDWKQYKIKLKETKE